MSEEQKKSKRWLGYLLVAVSVVLVIVAFAMFSQTWGTKLLYIDATTGRFCRFYWVPFVIAMVVLAVGIFTLKKHPKQVKTQTKVEEVSVQETPVREVTEAPETISEKEQSTPIEEETSEPFEVNEVAKATIKEEE